jgi:signal transduction histidine kinase
MRNPFSFTGESLSAEDLSALHRLAERLWGARHTIAVEWSRRLIEILPQYFTGVDKVAVGQLTAVNEDVLTLVLQQVKTGDLPALYQAYYDRNRQIIDADLQRAPSRRVSLDSLYTSARVSLRVIEDHLGAEDHRLMLAYAKLTAQLMMLVGQAYSDAREDYLQRTFEQINTLSHELRAPLSHLFSYLEMLQAGDFGSVSTEQQQVLGELIHETDDLVWLMTGMLDLSRLDTGRVEVRAEEFPLAAVFTDVVNSTARPIGALTWSVPAGLPLLRTDRVKVKQIVGNLVRNAVRYGGASPVTLAARMPRPGTVEITVRDQGPGIKPEELGVIFDFLERGNAARLARDGYGIGLHVVRRLVTLLGGTIAVESAPATGTCFRATLPMDAPELMQPR